MKRTALVATAAAMFVAAGTMPAEAQQYRFDIGPNVGFGWFSTMLDQEHTGTDNVTFEPGLMVGGQATLWFGGNTRFGIRPNVAWIRTELAEVDDPAQLGSQYAGLDQEVNLWPISGDLLIRLRTPNRTWMGSEALPYIALGAGIMHMRPLTSTALVEFDPPGADDGVLLGTEGNYFMLGEQNRFMGLVGLGMDFRLAPSFALRLEVGDRIWQPEIFELNRVTEEPGRYQFQEPREQLANLTHMVYGQVGAHLLLGLMPPPPVVIAPPPPPAPAPPPPPPPTTREVQVCVLDLNDPAGVRNLTAIYRIEERDTVVMRAGQEVAIGDFVADVTVAPQADWYVAGQPLVFEFPRAPRRAEFVTVGTSRVIQPEQLAYLGNMGGLPVFASRTDVAGVWDEWQQARTAAMAGTDIDDMIAQRAALRTAFTNVNVLYVPVQPVGCVFQAVERLEEVRKSPE